MSGHFLTATCELPCGHTLTKTCTVPETRPDWVRDCAEVLTWWMSTRSAKHRCELVGEDNPAGYPKTEPGTGFGEFI